MKDEGWMGKGSVDGKMKDIKVSVIIPVYNEEDYLRECMDSVLAQTLREIEIICVDDGSADDSVRILEEYARRDPRVMLVKQKNRYAGMARNLGMSRASGKYLSFLDADDFFSPVFLEKMYETAENAGADVVICNEKYYDSETGEMSRREKWETMPENHSCFSADDLPDGLFQITNGWAWDKLFRREFILETGLKFQNLKSSNDGLFVHAALASAERISLLNEVLVHHRLGNGNSVSNTRDRSWESCLLYLKELRRYLLKKELFICYEKSYLNWTMEFLYWNYQTLNERNREKLADAMRNFFIEELNVQQYNSADFYNGFNKWFADRIISMEDKKIPWTEEERFRKTYQLNDRKLKALQKYLFSHHWKAALWGAGIRGRAFAEVYGETWSSLEYAYDMDETKHGQMLSYGIIIQKFDAKKQEGPECILVLNETHLLSVLEKIKGKEAILFDMDFYLNSPMEIRTCVVK